MTTKKSTATNHSAQTIKHPQKRNGEMPFTTSSMLRSMPPSITEPTEDTHV